MKIDNFVNFYITTLEIVPKSLSWFCFVIWDKASLLIPKDLECRARAPGSLKPMIILLPLPAKC